MTTPQDKPLPRSWMASQFDDPSCNTGMSVARDIAYRAAFEVFEQFYVDLANHAYAEEADRAEAASDLAYEIAFAYRHKLTLGQIAHVAVQEAWTRMRERAEERHE